MLERLVTICEDSSQTLFLTPPAEFHTQKAGAERAREGTSTDPLSGAEQQAFLSSLTPAGGDPSFR